MKYFTKIPHAFLMLAGCVAMLVAIFALTSFTTGNNWGIYLLLLLCPAMHIFMHRGLHRNENLHELSKTPLPVQDTQESLDSKQKSLLE